MMPAGTKCRDVLNGKYNPKQKKSIIDFKNASREQLKDFCPTKLPFVVVERYNNKTQSCGAIIVCTVLNKEPYVFCF